MSCVWQQYDDWGERYLDHAATGTYNALYDRPTVLGLVGDVAGQRVLDAGCGPGLYAEAPASMGADVTAIDASEEQLRIARGRLGDSVRVQRAVLGDPLPFENETFDLIVCALVMHYLRDPSAAYAEFHRVLRAGGRAVISTHHPMADWLRKGGESYFEVREEQDIWSTPNGRKPMRYWRAPLTRICSAATTNGLLISRLIEPLPEAQGPVSAALWDGLSHCLSCSRGPTRRPDCRLESRSTSPAFAEKGSRKSR
jgi:SAM-dependent methyltransferase